jgi:putative ABC transport system substrate-binding protein
MKIGKIINGILAFILIAAVLLISDWENRSDEKSTSSSAKANKMYTFCLAQYVDSFNSEETEKGIREELLRQGFVEGENYTLKIFNAQGDVSTLNSIAEIIANEDWDIIFAASTPTIQSFSKKINNKPIVFTNVGDPLRAGLGESFQKHLSNITGISTMSDFDGLIDLVIASIPGIKTIGTVFTPGEINSVAYSEALKKAAEKRGLTLITVPANNASEVADASKAITSRGIQAITQISDNLTGSCYASIIKEAYNSRIPYFGFVSDQTNKGAIATLARDYYSAGADAVKMAVQIMNGKSPADIPFQYVSKTSIQVNKDAMKYFGVNIPERFLPEEIKITK